jgi:hypothetical protein
MQSIFFNIVSKSGKKVFTGTKSECLARLGGDKEAKAALKSGQYTLENIKAAYSKSGALTKEAHRLFQFAQLSDDCEVEMGEYIHVHHELEKKCKAGEIELQEVRTGFYAFLEKLAKVYNDKINQFEARRDRQKLTPEIRREFARIMLASLERDIRQNERWYKNRQKALDEVNNAPLETYGVPANSQQVAA